ncbi:MAG: hypothetical protein HY298_24725 [Verrucomicrobia bacterium]|nr:hypothetical protein [Verrucomicrobiota bacterium]
MELVIMLLVAGALLLLLETVLPGMMAGIVGTVARLGPKGMNQKSTCLLRSLVRHWEEQELRQEISFIDFAQTTSPAIV